MTPNDFFKEFAIGKLQIETDSQAFYYHSSIGSTIDAYVINIDEDTCVSLLYIPATENVTGLFIFAKKGTDGEFYEFFSKDPADYYSNVGDFKYLGNKRNPLSVFVGNFNPDTQYKIIKLVADFDFSLELKSPGDSIVLGEFYFELADNGSTINVREFKE